MRVATDLVIDLPLLLWVPYDGSRDVVVWMSGSVCCDCANVRRIMKITFEMT